MFGHNAKKPSGDPWQFEPPPQLRIPDLPMSDVPIRLPKTNDISSDTMQDVCSWFAYMMAVPVMTGGKTFLS